MTKLSAASSKVDELKAELNQKKAVVDAKTQDIENIINVIQKKTDQVTESNEEATAKQVATKKQAELIEKEK